MSFIAVELKVIEGLADSVARSAGVDPDRILAGLARLWHRCWVDCADHFGRPELAGIFGGADIDSILEALVEWRFLEPKDQIWRVRGAGRYLRLKQSRRRGAALTNARRAAAREASEPPPSKVSAPGREASPTTPKPKAPPNPRLAPLQARLEAEFAELRGSPYKHNGAADTNGLKSLIGHASDDEIAARWRKGLALATKWPGVSKFAQLASNWNELGAPAPTSTPRGPVDPATMNYREGRLAL